MTAQLAHHEDTNGYAVYCRLGEHDRCSMVCACPHHLEPRGSSWAELSQRERLTLVEDA